MNPYITKLKQELAAYEAVCGNEGASILDLLWYCYSASNAVDDGKIKEAEAAISPVYHELSTDVSNMLDDLIGDLCTAYQRAAFLEGIQVGVRLVEELQEYKL